MVRRKTFVCTTVIHNVKTREAKQMIIHDHDENALRTVRRISTSIATNVPVSAVF